MQGVTIGVHAARRNGRKIRLHSLRIPKFRALCIFYGLLKIILNKISQYTPFRLPPFKLKVRQVSEIMVHAQNLRGSNAG